MGRRMDNQLDILMKKYLFLLLCLIPLTSFAYTGANPLRTSIEFPNYFLTYNFKNETAKLTAKKPIANWLLKIATKKGTIYTLAKDQKVIYFSYIAPLNFEKIKAALVQVSLPKKAQTQAPTV